MSKEPQPVKKKDEQETVHQEMTEETHDVEDIAEEEQYEEDWDSDKSD